MNRFFIAGSLFAVLLTPAVPLWARVGENAVTDAEDAYGSSIGGENLGIYGPSDVRGFSPTEAGNVRLEGLYVDRQAEFTGRLVEGSRIRVGPAALDYALPAPTGIADYRIRRPGEERVISAAAELDTFGAANVEVDALFPLHRELGLAGGVGVYQNDYASGSTADVLSTAILGVWQPSTTAEVVPFWSRIDIGDEEAEPLVIGNGTALPERLQRRRFLGQPWADFEVERLNYGLLGRAEVAGLEVRGGVFRSANREREGYSILLEDAQPGTIGNRAVIASPGSSNVSTSGELTIARRFAAGRFDHHVQVTGRVRSQSRRYGGSDRAALPPAGYGTRSVVPRPQFTFGPRSEDEVEQWTTGLAYRARAQGLGQVNLGLQRTDYRKTVTTPAGVLPDSRDHPWLPSASAAIDVTSRLALYGGYVRGLEESDVAPETAINRDTAPPAIRTRQVDAGLRWRLSDAMTVITGVFEVEKPYYGVNDSNVFRQLGDVRHRGVELSIHGEPFAGLAVVAGAVFLDADVSGEQVRTGEAGTAPVGTPSRAISASIDWHPTAVPAFSLDLSAEHVGPQYADVGNAVRVPARTTVDVGVRYRFSAGDAPAVIRLQVRNLFDNYGWNVASTNVFTYTEPRILTAKLSVDF